MSGSRDKTIKLWNTLAQCKYTIQDEGHSDWVSCVRFSPNPNTPIIVSSGWDKYVKVSKSSIRLIDLFVSNLTSLPALPVLSIDDR